jgi:hypothetical protein
MISSVSDESFMSEDPDRLEVDPSAVCTAPCGRLPKASRLTNRIVIWGNTEQRLIQWGKTNRASSAVAESAEVLHENALWHPSRMLSKETAHVCE